ncbi:uncharacterized protein N0V89_011730 [Didymosphaeria variabile]|uniref:Heme haloperoxidase family profile domain-containing protein n=1 Tax=Didymosphaeria variabile TaxID=1932322 RepID=A0A9W8XC93_9PLEO|nr:uncharacterized protein N0V89_011730 [Didymosphaeria variabile]KAJ4345597.1 hypothetical protein N0V89_011730 [Didymosphaeria variabile]
MKFTQALLLALPALSAAYPGMSNADVEEYTRKRTVDEASLQERQLLTGLIGTVQALTNTVSGLLGAVANNISPDNKRPEPGYGFKAPGAGDSRGPCPGLNLLANHGYLPRNGHVTFQQVLEATSRGFNMGADLATVLATFAVLADGDTATESFYLGSLTGADGLNRHSTVEADVSPNREDYYNGCGDNHHLSSRMFKQNVGFAAADSSKQFTMDVMTKQYAANAQFSKDNNPYLYYFPFPQIVSLGAFAFYPNFFSNGTYGAGGVANYESISSIVGAEYDSKAGNFKYVPEKWPENWYRRATPYGVVQALTDAFLRIYPANIIVPAVAQVGTDNLSVQTLLCDVYQGINSVTPLIAAGSLEDTSKLVTWATNKLLPVLGKNTALGCPDSTLSPNAQDILFPNAAKVGGPEKSPPKSDAKTGNNVYNKVYFESAPVKPAC